MIPLKDENPTETFPYVTIALIVANVLVFFVIGPVIGSKLKLLVFYHGRPLLVKGSQALAFVYGAIPYELFHGVELTPQYSFPIPLTVITCMFLHGGFFHIAGNMLFLWIFGNNVEDELGHFRFLLFYLICGVLATFAHAAVASSSRVPMIGASGAISGILGAYMIRFPWAKIKTLVFLFFFITVIDIPALIFLGFWFLIQFLNGTTALGMGNPGGVAWFAHIGGFISGILLFRLFPKRKGRVKISYRIQ